MTNDTVTTKAPHPNYVAIWGVLVVALLVSLIVGKMNLPVVTLILIFSVAVVKAWLVIAYYMHLKFEPLFVAAMVVTGLVCLYILFLGLVPDIVFGPFIR